MNEWEGAIGLDWIGRLGKCHRFLDEQLTLLGWPPLGGKLSLNPPAHHQDLCCPCSSRPRPSNITRSTAPCCGRIEAS